jgi:hypothetical protein
MVKKSKFYFLGIIIILFLNCDTGVIDSGWLIEWKIGNVENNDSAKINYEFNINSQGKKYQYNGTLLDSGYLYNQFFIRGSVDQVNSISPIVSFRLAKNDSTLLDTSLSWKEMEFKCQYSQKDSQELCQLSKKVFNLP